MKPKHALFIAAVSIAVALTASPIAAAQSKPLATRQSDEGTVSVSVTPTDVSAAADVWRFSVQFNTHVTPILQDMVAVASLAGAATDERPTSWEGDPPGGHHRRGVLVFQPMNPRPAAVILHIRDVGGIADRTFTWDLGG